jgi:hypothetical protein
MANDLRCWRCGESLVSLSLPLARLDECPKCHVHLHVCRMCTYYAPTKPKGCREDDAIEVRDKKSANFCDYFKPSATAFDSAGQQAEQKARSQLDDLFKK